MPPRVDCCPAPRGEDEARLNQDRGRLEPLDCLARLDPPKSATVAGERGTLRGERSVLGSLMTRCPLARESVPRTRRMLFGEVDVSALSSSMCRHVCRPSAAPVAERLPIVPATRGLPRVRRITQRPAKRASFRLVRRTRPTRSVAAVCGTPACRHDDRGTARRMRSQRSSNSHGRPRGRLRRKGRCRLPRQPGGVLPRC